MVSAVHLQAYIFAALLNCHASKGLHMVSAVHPAMRAETLTPLMLQRGCTWLVQFIFPLYRPTLEDTGFKGAAHG